MPHVPCVALLLLCVLLPLATPQGFNGHLYVFSGRPTSSDFIATVDLVQSSSTYGDIIAETLIPGASVEAHHVSLVNNGSVLAGGSYLDFALKPKVDTVHFFDVGTAPAAPRYLSSVSPSQASVADTFASLPGGGFVATCMGGKTGGSPGRIVRFNSSLQITGEFSSAIKPESFNPHGIAVNAALGVMLTADFYDPLSAIVEPKRRRQRPVKYRTTVRMWNATTLDIIQVFDAGKGNAEGFMDMKFLGARPFAVTGNGQGGIYLVDVAARTFERVWSVPDRFLPTGSCVAGVFQAGTRALLTALLPRALFLLSWEDPKKPVLLDTYRLPKGAQPHAVVVTNDGSIAAVTCYFLDRPGLSKLVLPGDKTLRFFRIVNDTIQAHPTLPTIDFKKRYQTCGRRNGRKKCTGGANPHGIVFRASPVAAPGGR